ncbi:MAG TPA: Uma2 family endonuclease [Fimbriiglobus sp.]|jgi:Uma2 family endonuclease|nr:Uma2 family endonuclease [Fimbriiglobus sp.]
MATDILNVEPDAIVPTQLPDRYEVVNGEIVEVPPMSFYAVEVANLLNKAIVLYLLNNDIGRSRIDLLYRIPLPEDKTRNRNPDVAFISYDRWPRDLTLSLTGNALDVVPDLAVEVVSPTDLAEDVQEKAREYIRGGVRVAWQIYPRLREVHAFDGSPTIRIFTANDELDGGSVLPGFKVKMVDLFPATPPEESKDDKQPVD